ncbi:sigma-70 family RNA polymerase sigma factor [Streptomyces sp. NPDC057249]|uniref:sigma-70 family RNA polymerase sigma factor n=1 Tax=Streptomyces sp. NPDC057249 TaxID=3346067 RepID=UPI00363BEE16
MFAEKHEDLLAHARRCLAKENIPESRLGAEDLVQEAMTVTLANHSKQSIENLAGYVYKVISNKVRDESRRIGVAQPIDTSHHSVDQNRFIHVSALEEVGQDEAADYLDLENALLTLPEQQQRMVMLAKGFDYTHAEIADITGLHKGTISQHIRRGTRALTILLTGTASCLLFALFTCFASFGGERLVPASSTDVRAAVRKFDGYSPWATTLAVLALSVLLGAVWIIRSRIRRTNDGMIAELAQYAREMEAATRYGGALALSSLGREPTDEEFARQLSVTPETIQVVRSYMAHVSNENEVRGVDIQTWTRLAVHEVRRSGADTPRPAKLHADEDE